VVPELVLDEAINLFREDVGAQQQKIRGAIRELRTLRADPGIEEDALAVNVAVDGYRVLLNDVLKLAGAEVAPYPTTTHDDVVDRALRRDRPFAPDGKDGYRDALIWETIKTLARRSSELIVLISGDFRAFSPNQESSRLHRNLESELLDIGRSGDVVRRVTDVKTYTDAHVANDEPVVVELEHRLATEPALREAVFEDISAKLREIAIDQPLAGSLPVEIEVEVDHVSVDSVGEISHARVLSAKALGEDVLVELTVEAVVDLDLRLRKSDAAQARGDIFIWDNDFNESFVRASIEAQVEVPVEAIYLNGDLRVSTVADHVIGF
jgi:hypothetical protein